MKIKLSIFVFVITQITASFSSELRKAVLSVENSFEKLLTDVATDVRDTITCTLMAIEQAFTNDRFDMNSDYYKKCGGSPSEAATGRAQSRQQVNDQKPQRFANNARSRLADVTRLLKQEIGKVSENIRKRFKKFTLNENDPSIENVWQSIKILHEIGKGNQNNPEAIEVGQVIDKVLDVLDIEESPEKTENDKIEDVINNLVENSSDSSEFTKIKSELNEWKHEDKTLDIKESLAKTENNKIEDVMNNIVQNSSNSTELTKNKSELNEWKYENKTLDSKEVPEKIENNKIEDVMNNLVPNSSDHTELTKNKSELNESKYEDKALDIKEGPEKIENDKIEDVINNLVQNSSDGSESIKNKFELNEWKHENKTLDIKEVSEKTEKNIIEDVINNLAQNSSDHTDLIINKSELNESKYEDKTLDIKEGSEKTKNDKIEDVINNLVQNSSDGSEFIKNKSELIEWKHDNKTLDIKEVSEKMENDRIEDVIKNLVHNSSDESELIKNKSELNEWKYENKTLDINEVSETENNIIEDVINNLAQNSSDNTEFTKNKMELNEWKNEDKTLDIKEGPEKTESNIIEDGINNFVQHSSDNTEFIKKQAELNEWKHKPFNSVNSITVEEPNNSTVKNVNNDFPRSFKEVVKKLNNGTQPTVNGTQARNDSDNTTTTINKVDITTCGPPDIMPITTTQAPIAPTTELADESEDYDSFFGLSSNKNRLKNAVRQANKIIEDSKRAQMILDSFFKSASLNAKNVFDDPDLMTFK